MKKAIASGLIGLMALGGTAAVTLPSASAQEEPTEETRERPTDEERAERRAFRQEQRAERIAIKTDILGLTQEELHAAKDAGQSLADVAAAQGVDLQVLIDALVADFQETIQERLDAGFIDAERADELTANAEERITARINGERPEGKRGPRGR